MTVVALVRHGRTEWNDTGRIQGSSDVVTIDDVGRAQALAAALALLEEPYAWDVLVASPLRRAVDTAGLIADRLGLPVVETVPDLVERDFGAAEGMVEEVAFARWPDKVYPGLEDPPSVVRRGRAALDHLAATRPGGHVVAVSHGGLIRHTLRSLSGGEDIPVIVNGSASIVVRDGSDGAWTVRSVNDVVSG